MAASRAARQLLGELHVVGGERGAVVARQRDHAARLVADHQRHLQQRRRRLLAALAVEQLGADQGHALALAVRADHVDAAAVG
jgi:hypothetical protein